MRSMRSSCTQISGISCVRAQRSDEPDRFDIRRAPGKHIAFGFGTHGCLGAGLARRELEIGLVSLIRRMPGLRLDDQSPPVRRCESVMFRGFRRLPVVFS
ncbi:cytochrome P450 [Sorangium sp. So ce542]|uniref:cytochrome P450 n=1 Tax=Sorangium sp. So ce542 TaxID=3133316 RepID=UPI003F61104F